MEIGSLDPSDAHLVTGRNEKRFTIDFIQGGHMVPNERPDLVGEYYPPPLLLLALTNTNTYANDGKSIGS